MSNFDYSLDKKFETTIMYYFSFDETYSTPSGTTEFVQFPETKVSENLQKAKDIQTLNKLIEMYNIVYKLIFEVIYQNNQILIDYDIESNKELILKDEYNISKLYILKRSETKSNMIYTDINKQLVEYLEKNPSLEGFNIDLSAIIQEDDNFDSNIDKQTIAYLLKTKLKLTNVNVNVLFDKSNKELFKTEWFKYDEFMIKIEGNYLFVSPSINFLKNSLTDENSVKITPYINQENKLDNLVFQYNIKYLFY